MKIGKNLYELRKRAKLSRQDVAEYLNVKPNTYGNWENDKTMPSAEYMPNLAKLFKVKLEDLYVIPNPLESGESVKEKLIESNKQIIDLLQNQINQFKNN